MRKLEAIDGLYYNADDVRAVLQRILSALKDHDSSLWVMKDLIQDIIDGVE